MKKNYFTLKELCVVVFTLSTILTIAFSSYSDQLKAGKKTICAANLHKLYSAMQSYGNDNDSYLFSYLTNGSAWCSASTYIRLIPYVNTQVTLPELLKMTPANRDNLCPKEFICPDITPDKSNFISQYAYALPYSFKHQTPYKLFGNAQWKSPNGLIKYNPASLIVAGDSQVCNDNYTAKNFRAVNLSHEKSEIGCSILKLRHDEECNLAMLDGSVQNANEDAIFDGMALPVMNPRGVLVANRLDAIYSSDNEIIKY
jgi:prepilin-type processing-associated H-X9-DG protein